MAKKKSFIKDLVIGEAFQNEVFSIKSIDEDRGNDKCFTLSDNSGVVLASMPKNLIDKVPDLIEGCVVEVSGVVLKDGMQLMLRIKDISLCTDFLPTELFQGISLDKREECKAGIAELKGRLTHPEFRQLVDACLTDEALNRMAELPATLNLYGKYNGGALVATNAVGHMVLSSMASYTKRGNAFTTKAPQWNALLCASLLFLYGNIEFFTTMPPYKRTKIGVEMGYFSVLQKMLERTMSTNNIIIADDDLARLFNILKVSVEDKSSVKATSKDGAVLRHIIALYCDCDSFDWETATHEKEGAEESYFYSSKLGRYIVAQEG